MYFPTKMFGISLYLQAFDFFGYFFNFYIDSTLSFCLFSSLNIALNFVCFCLKPIMILILFPVIFSRSIHRVCVFCWLEHRGKISLFFFLMFIISIKTLVQRVIIRGAKFENGSPSFRLFFSCCCCCWCSSWLFERPKLKRQIKRNYT